MSWTARSSSLRAAKGANLPVGWRPHPRMTPRHRTAVVEAAGTAGPGYVLGIGTNIDAERNAARIIECLVQRFGLVRISRIYYTSPVAMDSRRRFVNFCAFVPSALRPLAFKAECNRIETLLGRDRDNPRRSVLDRPADLDPLLRVLDRDSLDIPTASVADYLACPARELLALLTTGETGLTKREATSTQPRCRVRLHGWVLGETPATIHRDDRTGQIVVS